MALQDYFTHFKSSQSILYSYSSERPSEDFVFIFDLGFTAHQDYFTHFELNQSLGGAKTRDPRGKPPNNPQAELG